MRSVRCSLTDNIFEEVCPIILQYRVVEIQKPPIVVPVPGAQMAFGA